MEERKERAVENLTDVQRQTIEKQEGTQEQAAGKQEETQKQNTEKIQEHPAEESGEIEDPKNTQGQTTEEGKQPKKKGCLGCLGNIVIVTAVILLLMKGAEWLGRLQAPEENNSASVKARSYNFIYVMCAGKFGEPFGEEGKITFGERVLPILDWFMLEDDKSTVGTDDINTLLTSKYTMDDEDMLAAYTGRKVKLTGKIVQKSDSTIRLVTDVNSDPLSFPEELQTVFLNCEWIKDKPEINECVEVEGMLIVDPVFSEESSNMDISVIVREVREADYVTLGGSPENRFMFQKTEPVTSVEQQGAKLDILGASVDAATGRAYVKYRLAIDKKEWDNMTFNIHGFGAKGSLVYSNIYTLFPGEILEGGIVLVEENPYYTEQIMPGDNQISIIICGYKYNTDVTDVNVDPDADIFLRVDIPSESWVVVE